MRAKIFQLGKRYDADFKGYTWAELRQLTRFQGANGLTHFSLERPENIRSVIQMAISDGVDPMDPQAVDGKSDKNKLFSSSILREMMFMLGLEIRFVRFTTIKEANRG